MWKLILSAILVFYPSLACAQATVIVPATTGEVWEIRGLSFAPRKSSDQGVSVDDVNAWNSTHGGMKQLKKICLMDFVQDSEVFSSDSKTQNEIASDLKEYPGTFFQIYVPDASNKFLVRVAAFQMCEPSSDGEYISFMALTVTDSLGRIMYFDEMPWTLTRLFKRGDGVINVLGCFACGEVKELAWDRLANRFYVVDIGH